MLSSSLMLSISRSLSSILMHRVARNLAAGARGPAGALIPPTPRLGGGVLGVVDGFCMLFGCCMLA